MQALLHIFMVLQSAVGAPEPSDPHLWEACTDEAHCGSGDVLCFKGVCLPDNGCEAASDCPAPPQGGYAVKCEIKETCDGEMGMCRLGPDAKGNCPQGMIPDTSSEDRFCIIPGV